MDYRQMIADARARYNDLVIQQIGLEQQLAAVKTEQASIQGEARLLARLQAEAEKPVTGKK